MKKELKYASIRTIIFSVVILLCPLRVWGQDTEFKDYQRDTLIVAAKEIMETSGYCALISFFTR